MDHLRSAVSSLFSGFSILLGVVTVNDIAIGVGIASGLSVIVERAISSVIKIKQYKKNVNGTNE